MFTYRLDKKTKDLNNAEKNLTIYESRAADLSAKYNQAQADRKKAADELKVRLKRTNIYFHDEAQLTVTYAMRIVKKESW